MVISCGGCTSPNPAPTLRQLRVPTLALFGELDNNIMADKNKAAWDTALQAGGHRGLHAAHSPEGESLSVRGEGWKQRRNGRRCSGSCRVLHHHPNWLAKRMRGFGPSR